MTDGAPLTAWQRTVIAEWHRRHPKPLMYPGTKPPLPLVPQGCYCLRCGTPALMFPGETLEFPGNQGCCICPKCSQPKKEVVSV